MPTTGVYKISNNVTGAVYVGASGRSISERWGVHRRILRAQRHPNELLQEDWNTYGAGAFTFEVVEVVTQGRSRTAFLERLDRRERYHINRARVAAPVVYNVKVPKRWRRKKNGGFTRR